jgi:hypothetical protein
VEAWVGTEQAFNGGFIGGRIDELTVYGSALSAESLYDIYLAGPIGKSGKK